MHRLIAVNSANDILPQYRGTPIGLLLEYHNLGRTDDRYSKAELLVGMCMDSRKYLVLPDNFAFILRTGGANLRYSQFKISFAIGVAKLSNVALIGHSNCGMVNLMSKKDAFVSGLVEIAGWEKQRAEEHFMNYAPMFEIDNEIDFLISEANRLRGMYPRVRFAPLYYKVEDNRIYQIKE